MTTPAELTPDVLAFCSRVEPQVTPVYVEVAPVRGAEVNECLPNVCKYIRECGGSQQQGWTIWYEPGEWIEAGYHAVWVSPEGKLIDMTPKADGETRILFLPTKQKHAVGDLLPFTIRKILKDTIANRMRFVSGTAEDRLRKQHHKPGMTKIPWTLSDQMRAAREAASELERWLRKKPLPRQ